MHHDLNDLDWVRLRNPGHNRAAVLLEKGDTVENPASTKGPIHGPASVTFDRYPDGGIDVIVEDHPNG